MLEEQVQGMRYVVAGRIHAYPRFNYAYKEVLANVYGVPR